MRNLTQIKSNMLNYCFKCFLKQETKESVKASFERVSAHWSWGFTHKEMDFIVSNAYKLAVRNLNA